MPASVIRMLMAVALAGGLAPVGAEAAVPDPTRPATAAEVRAWSGRGGERFSAWRLESVLIADSRRVAVINGDRVGVGDLVNGAEVVAIDAGRVTLRTGGREIELVMNRPWIKGKQ